jgi:lipid II:glycine glycyltransferase (peptidoglycan interpeptide bridge formation enzyme)
LDGTPVSGIILIASGDRGYGILAGTTQHGYEIGGSPFTILNMLRTLQKEGMKYFNLGGLPGGESGNQLEKFKIAMGASDLKCIGGSTEFLQGAHQRIPMEIVKKLRS